MQTVLSMQAPRLTGRQEHDFYRTPPAATRALLEKESPPLKLWEPACGDGAISKVLEAAGYQVRSSDLHDRGFGEAGIDFFGQHEDLSQTGVITNPPFKIADQFARHALLQGAPYVALLHRLAWLEGAERRRDLWIPFPPARVWVFSKRMTLWRGDEDRPAGASGTTAYAWFVWERGSSVRPGPVVGWL